MNKQELTAALNSIEPEDFKELLHYLCAYRINSISVISHYGVPYTAPPNEEKGYWREAREQFVNKYVELIEVYGVYGCKYCDRNFIDILSLAQHVVELHPETITK